MGRKNISKLPVKYFLDHQIYLIINILSQFADYIVHEVLLSSKVRTSSLSPYIPVYTVCCTGFQTLISMHVFNI